MKKSNSFSIVILVLFIVISIIELISSIQAMDNLKPILNGNTYYPAAAITLARAANSVLVVWKNLRP